jgi:uncharacterized protein (TIGR02118 family)
MRDMDRRDFLKTAAIGGAVLALDSAVIASNVRLQKGDGYMIKLVFCAKRHPSMSRAEFQDYWLNHHGPLFQTFADTYRAVRYVQSHTINSPLNENIRKSRGMSEAYDGVGEIWWQSEEDFLAAINSPEGQKLRTMFVEDEAKFVDLSASSAFFTVEHVLIDRKV